MIYGIKLCNKNIGFNGQFYTFPYFLTFLLKKFTTRTHAKKLRIRTCLKRTHISDYNEIDYNYIRYAIKVTFYFFTFEMVWMILPSLSIIDILNCFLSTVKTEKPSAELQNTVPSIGFTGRAKEEEELTT